MREIGASWILYRDLSNQPGKRGRSDDADLTADLLPEELPMPDRAVPNEHRRACGS
jgi:hypothetical protein